MAEIKDSSVTPQTEILKRKFPVDAQKVFGREASEKIGFEYDRGRLDIRTIRFVPKQGQTIAASPRVTMRTFLTPRFLARFMKPDTEFTNRVCVAIIMACRRDNIAALVFTNLNRDFGKTWSAVALVSGTTFTQEHSSFFQKHLRMFRSTISIKPSIAFRRH